MTSRTALRGFVLAFVILHVAGSSAAHPLAPSLLELQEDEGGAVQVLWKVSALKPVGVDIEPILPPHCQAGSSPSAERVVTAVVAHWSVDCAPEGLRGSTVGVRGLEASSTNALLRIVRPDGTVLQALLTGASPTFVVSDGVSVIAVAWDYMKLGVDHLVFGFDHVLFILGLILLINGTRRLLLTVTAFTVGHSVTLVLATLGYVNVPTNLVEIGIAATILVLAAELALGSDHPSLLRRRPWAMAFSFGLLHGLGFAGALADVGLPPDEIPLALFSFNVGIEVGQVMIAAGALLTWAITRRLTLDWANRIPQAVPAYGIGSLAGFWFLERTLSWLGGWF